jgi:hypothetical protein
MQAAIKQGESRLTPAEAVIDAPVILMATLAEGEFANKSRLRNSMWQNDLAQKRTIFIHIC